MLIKKSKILLNLVLKNITNGIPWGDTEWDGGGSQTCVVPALAKSSIEFLSELYKPPGLLHDSQLKP